MARPWLGVVGVMVSGWVLLAAPGPIHDAARAGDLTAVRALVAANPRLVDQVDSLGQTPLHVAARAGRSAVVDLLLAWGASPKAVSRDGRTLVHFAAAGGLVGLLERLAREGVALDARDRYGRTPLFDAAEAGSDGAAELLLARGASVMNRDYHQTTPLHAATFTGNLRLLDLLVRNGADVNAVSRDGSTPLLYVSQAGRGDVIDWLLAHGARLDARNQIGETIVSWPLVNGFVDLVEQLWPRVEALKDRDLLEKYPLHRAAYHGNLRAAAFLLGKGVSADAVDESGRTPLQRAAQGGNAQLAEMLIANGARIDAADRDGAWPLHLAVKKGQADMVRLLLQKGANPNATDREGRTPLDLSRAYSFPTVATLLEGGGAKPGPGVRPPDLPSLLARPLRDGQATVWALGHCGFAIKTRTRLLIFDYIAGRGRRPERPSLANGFVDPEEIKDQRLVVFVTHDHPDHFDRSILSWRAVVKDITYVFGWSAGVGGIELHPPRGTRVFDGVEVFTVDDEHDTVAEVAYLVKVDGVSVVHMGDYSQPLDTYSSDMRYLASRTGRVDIGFFGRVFHAKALAPRLVVPMHAWNREYMYDAFAREAADEGVASRILRPENRGDRFELEAAGRPR